MGRYISSILILRWVRKSEKRAPALISQNDIANQYSPITIVAAITSRFEEVLYPTEVLTETSETGIKQNSVILLNQIQSIDKERIVKRLGILGPETMEQVNRAIELSLGLTEL